MRISNISEYLGGADNVIAKEIIEGDQQVLQFKLGTQDFTDYTFEVDTELFKASITKRGSTIKIDSLTPVSQLSDSDAMVNGVDIRTTLVNNGVAELHNGLADDNGNIILDSNDSTLVNLVIPSTLLSNLTTQHAPADVTNPFVVAMSVTLNSNTDINVKQSFRLLLIVRYRPMAN